MKQQALTWFALTTAITLLTSGLAALLVGPPSAAGQLRDATWSVNVPLSGPDAVPRSPAVALNGAGTAYAAWHDARPGAARGIYIASRPAGGAWTTPVRLPGSEAGNPGSPTIAAGAADNVYVAWVSGFPDARADIRFAWSTDGGGTWRGPVQVNTDPQDIAGRPDLAVDGRGNVHLVWSDLAVFGDPHSRDIKWAMRPAGQQTWTEPVVVHADVQVFTEQARPAITADGAGSIYAIWEDARHGPDDAHAIYAARLPAGTTQWEPGWRVDHRPGETNARPDIAAAPDGTLYAVWDAGAAGDVYGAILRPGAEAWEGPTPVRRAGTGQWSRQPGKTLNGDSAPGVAVDMLGIAYAVWQDARNGDLDIYSGVLWPGAGQWGPNIRVNDDAGIAAQEAPAVAAGRAGSVVAVWLDYREGGSGAVYAAGLEIPIHMIRLPLVAHQAQAGDQGLTTSYPPPRSD